MFIGLLLGLLEVTERKEKWLTSAFLWVTSVFELVTGLPVPGSVPPACGDGGPESRECIWLSCP